MQQKEIKNNLYFLNVFGILYRRDTEMINKPLVHKAIKKDKTAKIIKKLLKKNKESMEKVDKLLALLK